VLETVRAVIDDMVRAERSRLSALGVVADVVMTVQPIAFAILMAASAIPIPRHGPGPFRRFEPGIVEEHVLHGSRIAIGAHARSRMGNAGRRP